jgi:Fic/DOC family
VFPGVPGTQEFRGEFRGSSRGHDLKVPPRLQLPCDTREPVFFSNCEEIGSRLANFQNVKFDQNLTFGLVDSLPDIDKNDYAKYKNLSDPLSAYVSDDQSKPHPLSPAKNEISCAECMMGDASLNISHISKCIPVVADLLGIVNLIRSVEVRTAPDSRGQFSEYPCYLNIRSNLQSIDRFVSKYAESNSVAAAIVCYIGILHCHPLQDGNGRLARVLFRTILGRKYGRGAMLCIKQNSKYLRTIELLKTRRVMFGNEWIAFTQFLKELIDLYCEYNNKNNNLLNIIPRA